MYLLDTNIVNFLLHKDEKVTGRLEAAMLKGDIFVSSIVLEEILQIGYFAAINTVRSTGKGDLAKTFDGLVWAMKKLSVYEYLPYTNAMERVAKTLKIKGMDAKIAAHALELGFVLVTENTKDFEKVSGLLLENWTE